MVRINSSLIGEHNFEKDMRKGFYVNKSSYCLILIPDPSAALPKLEKGDWLLTKKEVLNSKHSFNLLEKQPPDFLKILCY